MEELKKQLVDAALDLGAEAARIFALEDICFDPRTLLKCFFGCRGGYHFCPTPKDVSNALTYSQIIRHYHWGIILRTGDLPTGHRITLALESRAFLAGRHFALGATECGCQSCTFPENKPCRNKKDMRLPLYAFGIDVYKTVRGLGWELEVVQKKGDPAKNITAVFVE